jgi:hypothetical protein
MASFMSSCDEQFLAMAKVLSLALLEALSCKFTGTTFGVSKVLGMSSPFGWAKKSFYGIRKELQELFVNASCDF